VLRADPCLDRTREAARALVGERIRSMRKIAGGRNSRVFRVETAGTVYALKQYPARADDPRDRLGTEAAALELMRKHGIDRIPRLLALDRQRGSALLSWIDGLPMTSVGEADIEAAAAFLALLHALRASADFPSHHLASEACLSGAEIVRQIETRLARLRMLPAAETALHAFLERTFAPALRAIMHRVDTRCAQTGIGLNEALPFADRSLVPSDFGFHNSLRAPDGSLVFLDFEYFGWDDPVKVTADCMLHPGIPLPAPLRRRLRAAAERLYGEDPRFARRLAAYYQLFGLRWVLILLNDFLPNRGPSGLPGAADSWQSVKLRQLAKACEFLAKVMREHDERGDGG
jgi:hypothetical protein